MSVAMCGLYFESWVETAMKVVSGVHPGNCLMQMGVIPNQLSRKCRMMTSVKLISPLIDPLISMRHDLETSHFWSF